MKIYSHYTNLVNHLKKHILLKYPVSVRRTKLSKTLDGDVKLNNGKFFIRINRNLPENSAIDTIIHEISHCLVLEKHQGHGLLWGKAYSKVYKEYLRWLEKE